MSSTCQATSSTSNIQLFIDALADYANITGIDLATNTFAAALEQSASPEAILKLLQDREKAFKEYREGDRRLISCLSPAVKILQAFSGILGEAARLVGHRYNLKTFLTRTLQIPFSPANLLFAGIDTLLDVRPFEFAFLNSPVIYVFARLPVESRRVTMRYSTSLNAWAISSSVSRYIRPSRQPR